MKLIWQCKRILVFMLRGTKKRVKGTVNWYNLQLTAGVPAENVSVLSKDSQDKLQDYSNKQVAI